MDAMPDAPQTGIETGAPRCATRWGSSRSRLRALQRPIRLGCSTSSKSEDADPEQKPLAVFFNGGPGSATSVGLLTYGTARQTLNGFDASAAPTVNAASWTSFANVLYIDERQTGFSYGIEPDAGPPVAPEQCIYSPVEDAADYAWRRSSAFSTVTRPCNGPRSSWWVRATAERGPPTSLTSSCGIRPRRSARTPRSAKNSVSLRCGLSAFAGTVILPALARTQFGRAVLIEPLVAGGLQFTTQTSLHHRRSLCVQFPCGANPYDVQQDAGWSDGLGTAAAMALGDPATATLFLTEEDPRNIPLFRTVLEDTGIPEFGRGRGGRGVPGQRVADRCRWGFAGGRRLSAIVAPACNNVADVFEGIGCGNEFLANLKTGVNTFITNSRYDAVIYSPAIPASLPQIAVGTTVESYPNADEMRHARLGAFSVTFAGDGGASQTVSVRFPSYVSSGHMVTATEPQNFHDERRGVARCDSVGQKGDSLSAHPVVQSCNFGIWSGDVSSLCVEASGSVGADVRFVCALRHARFVAPSEPEIGQSRGIRPAGERAHGCK